MKLCEKEVERKTYKGNVPQEIKDACNKVKCVDAQGNTCECWMEYPSDQPFHDKDAEININKKVDTNLDFVYYGLTAVGMGLAGIVLFLFLWAGESGIF